MKISYTGRQDALLPKQRAKLEEKVQKLSKMLERKGEKEAHVVHTQQRFLHKIEITISALDRSMIGIGSNGDPVVAANDALDKLEKQIMKQRAKWREPRRHKDKETPVVAAPAPAPVSAKNSRVAAASKNGPKGSRKKVFRVDHSDGSKPMTVEEAMLEMEASQDYMVYRDASTDKVSVLMRRADGDFDLIES